MSVLPLKRQKLTQIQIKKSRKLTADKKEPCCDCIVKVQFQKNILQVSEYMTQTTVLYIRFQERMDFLGWKAFTMRFTSILFIVLINLKSMSRMNLKICFLIQKDGTKILSILGKTTSGQDCLSFCRKYRFFYTQQEELYLLFLLK